MGLMAKVFGDPNDKEIKRIEKTVAKIEELDAQMQSLSDDALKAKTQEFKSRLSAGETTDDILPEAFAVVREASQRVLGIKPFHVQLVGGVVLHEGNIAEMKTGEGKTLVATLPVYLNALEGKGVHVVTVNDYLAQRDKEWMGQVYEFLGLSVGCIIAGLDPQARRAAYEADITYGTNNEFGFDYLRDNMAIFENQQMQRPLNYAIVDEVDSILIDEARTPLIISGMGVASGDLYKKADRFVRTLTREEDYTVDEKDRTAALTEEGTTKCEKYFNIENFADPENMEINHHVQIALRAHSLMKLDTDYIIKDGEIIIVDAFTGRLMYGRRYSDGLHQAIEAKEGIDVRAESKTLATITLQNYFRMYNKLAGMTGTAKTEENEFMDIYNMKVVVIPTNRPVVRQDLDDAVYSTQKGKYKAVIEDIVERHQTGQPVLVGTVSVEKSEMLSEMLKRRGVKHEVLNAKQHMREAEIVAKAGQFGAVTIATNMAGRGTDIKLGEGVREVGGLHIIGTERHEARRIDNQLRGRSGRQGDPGSSRFYVALDDDLMRLFGGDRIQGIMGKLGLSEDDAVEAGMLSKTIENAQKQVEGRNYGIRKYVLQYDDVMNRQRTIIYDERNKVLHGESLKDHILSMMQDIAKEIAEFITADSKYPEEWDGEALNKKIREISANIKPVQIRDDMTPASLEAEIMAHFTETYDEVEKNVGEEHMRAVERMVLLRIVDSKWMDHIDAMDQLKTGIGLRSMGGEDPALAYANEGSDMFDYMIKAICDEMVRVCFNIKVDTNEERKSVIRVGNSSKEAVRSAADEEREKRAMASARAQGVKDAPKEIKTARAEPVRVAKKPGRNDPCPCGSGKKYKNCCGKNE